MGTFKGLAADRPIQEDDMTAVETRQQNETAGGDDDLLAGGTAEIVSPPFALMPVMSVDEAQARDAQLRDFFQRCMEPGVDYDTGETFGGDKPSLLQPGAQKLQAFFGLSAVTRVVQAIEDWTGEHHDGEPLFAYRSDCRIYRGATMIANGIGMASTREASHRWRWVKEPDLPPGVDPSMFKSRTVELIEFAFAVEKAETTGPYGKPKEYWSQFDTAIEAGTARKATKITKTGKTMDAWAIGGTLYRVPNEDVANLAGNVLKISNKRAYVDAIIRATGASALFTQDGEDADANARATTGAVPVAPAPAAKRPARGPSLPMRIDPIDGELVPDMREADIQGLAFRDARVEDIVGRRVDTATGEVVETNAKPMDGAVAQSMLIELSPAAWAAAKVKLTKAMQAWKTLADCDITTLEAFAAITPTTDRSQAFVEGAMRVLAHRYEEAGAKPA